MYRAILTFLAALWLALPATAQTAEMTDVERAQFRAEVRAYLMENPEVIMQAIEVLRGREAEEQSRADFDLVTANAEEVFNDGFSYVGGNPDGDITLVEFLDYRCGYCKKAHSEVAKLLETDGNIRLIVKEFPILGEDSVLASRFAVAVKQIAGDETYKAVSDGLMEMRNVDMGGIRRLGEAFGLDMKAIEKRMDSDAVTKVLSDTRALGQKLQISGTPTFVMKDELLRGYLPYDQMKALIAEKRG